jgi:hypothetical protein
MLKIYLVTNYVSIDGADWREVGYGGYQAADQKPGDIEVHNLSFDKVREYLETNRLDGVRNDATLFRKRPIISVRYTGAWDAVGYRHFDTLSYKREFKEWTDVTLEWIMKNLSADECIQYLKERGMTACPILK